MRPIDAEALTQSISKKLVGLRAYEGRRMVEIVADCIVNAPTIEEKPVVHCKDCKYNVANRQQDPLDITDYTDIVCDYFMTDGMEADDFCSKGIKIPVISMEDVPKIAKEMEK